MVSIHMLYFVLQKPGFLQSKTKTKKQNKKTKKNGNKKKLICFFAQKKKGIYVVDFGQNVAGWTEIRIPGNQNRGENVTLIHSEEIDENGYVVQMYSNSPMVIL